MKIGEKYAARNASDDDNMVPLINVVFLMLVFFMVAGQIQKADPIAVIPPESINDNRAETDPSVAIFVGLNNELYVEEDVFQIEDVKGYLEREFEQAEDKDGFWVQIKADGSIPLEKLRPVFDQVRQAGLTKVSLATQLERGTQ